VKERSSEVGEGEEDERSDNVRLRVSASRSRQHVDVEEHHYHEELRKGSNKKELRSARVPERGRRRGRKGENEPWR